MKYKKVKQLIVSSILCLFVSTTLGTSVTGIRTVNNTSSNSDYKLSEEDTDSVVNSIKSRSDIIELFIQKVDPSLTDNDIINYLISNNIISRETRIDFSQEGIDINSPTLNFYESLSKTEILMMIYKCKNGVINSRPFVYTCDSRRAVNGKVKYFTGVNKYTPAGYDGTETSFDFSEGDKEIYISPNVEELYLTQLLKDGIIKESEIKDKDFISEYEKIISDGAGKLPEWWNELQPYDYINSKVDPSTQLGSTWEFKGIMRVFNAHTTDFHLEKVEKKFFVSERMTKLELYKYICSIYEFTDVKGDMKELSFMYGNADINDLSDEDRKNVFVLLEKGIIDLDSDSEVLDLESKVTTNDVMKIMYRLHSEDNRCDNTVELSEQDKAFIEEGYNKDSLSVVDNSKSAKPVTVSITEISSPIASYKFNFASKGDTGSNIRYTAFRKASLLDTIKNGLNSIVDTVKDVVSVFSPTTGELVDAVDQADEQREGNNTPQANASIGGANVGLGNTDNVTDNPTTEDTAEGDGGTSEESSSEESSANSTTTEVRLTGKTIVIDPGHGSKDVKVPGTDKTYLETSEKSKPNDDGSADTQLDTGGAPDEYPINWDVAQKLKSKLEGKGAKVILTKDSADANAGNQERAKVANDNNADMMIRLHCDDSSSRSTGAFYCMPEDTSEYFTESVKNTTKDYSEKIVTKVSEATGVTANEPILEPLTGAYWSKVPSVLIEMGNLSDATEKSNLQNEDFQNKLATGMMEGILSCIGAEEEVENAPVTLASSTPSAEEEEEDDVTMKEYAIVRIFPKPDKVTYDGKGISELKAGDSDVKSVASEDSGTKVEFTIKARNDIEALALLDSKTNYKVIADSETKLQTVTKLTTDAGSTTYISKSELSKNLGEITVLTNKVLKNSMTGDMAVLLEENNTALIGNRVVKTKDPIVIVNSADTYYNLEVIASLMTNAYLSELDPGKLFINTDLVSESYVNVEGTSGTIERTKVINNTALSDITFSDVQRYYDITTTSKAVSTLVRDYTIDGKKATLIVDWSYSLPTDSEGNLDTSISDLYKDENFTVRGASEFLYTRPADGETTQEWWDNNIDLSNALANLVYGTKGTKYITSGYLKPDVTLLLYDDLDNTKAIQSVFQGFTLSDNYINKYLDGDISGFNVKLFGGTGDVTNRRMFNCIKAEKSALTGYYAFGSTYIASPTGSVYKAIKSDSRLKYNSDSKTLQLNKETTADIVPDGMNVDFNGNQFYLVGQFGRYYKLVSTTPIRGRLTREQNTTIPSPGSIEATRDLIITDGTDDKLYETIDGMISDLGLQGGEYKPLTSYRKEEFSTAPDTQLYRNGSVYFADNKVYLAYGTTLQEKNAEDYLEQEVQAYPTIYISCSDFTVRDGQVKRQNSNPYLEQGNVFFSGINSTLMSRLIDNQLESISYNSLPMGANVIIQDFNFKKTTNGLNSTIVHDSSFTNELLTNSNTPMAVQTIAAKFTGLSILYSGREVPFTSYVVSGDVGDLNGDTGANNTVYKSDTAGMQFKASDTSSEELYTNQSANSICFTMTLDEELEFYCIDSKAKTYLLKQSTDKYSEGYISNNPFFSEDLGLTIYDDAYFDMYTKLYNGVSNYQKYFDESNDLYDKYIKGDLIKIVQSILAFFLAYLILMSWIIYAVLKLNVGLNYLLHLRNPSGMKGAEGFDLIKVLSFGLFNLDSEVNSGVFFVGDILFFLLFYINYNLVDILQKMIY